MYSGPFVGFITKTGFRCISIYHVVLSLAGEPVGRPPFIRGATEICGRDFFFFGTLTQTLAGFPAKIDDGVRSNGGGKSYDTHHD